MKHTTRKKIDYLIILSFQSNEMIIYDKLWKTMKEKNISTYKLIKEYNLSTGQLDRLKKNMSVTTNTLNHLCKILDCRLEDIAEYVEDDEPIGW